MNATPTNITTFSVPQTYQMHLTTVIPNMILSILAFVFNALLLLVLFYDPFRQFRTPSTVFVANLAIADILTGILTSLRTMFLYSRFDSFRSIGHRIAFLSFWAMQCSLFTVLFITGERVLAVLNPIKFKMLVTKCRTFYLSLGTWVLSVLNFNISNIFNDRSYNLTVLVVCVFNLLAISLTVTGYFALYKLLRKKQDEMNQYVVPESGQSGSDTSSLRQKQKAFNENKKLVSTFLIVTIVLIVTMAPVMSLIAATLFCSFTCRVHIHIVLSMYEPLTIINFVVNPIIYAFRLPQYRKAFWVVSRRILRCARRSNAISDL